MIDYTMTDVTHDRLRNFDIADNICSMTTKGE